MTSPVEALSPLRPAGQTPARAETRPSGTPDRSRSTGARPAPPQPSLPEGLGENLDVLA